MVAARRDPVRRQPAAHRDRQAAQDRACASNIGTTSWPPPTVPDRHSAEPVFRLRDAARLESHFRSLDAAVEAEIPAFAGASGTHHIFTLRAIARHDLDGTDRHDGGAAARRARRSRTLPRRTRVLPPAPRGDRRARRGLDRARRRRGRAQSLRRALVRRRLAAHARRGADDPTAGGVPRRAADRPAAARGRKGYARCRCGSLQSGAHDQMFLGTPLVAAGEERAFWRAALDAARRGSWAPGLLHLRGLVEDGPVHRGLSRAAACRRIARSAPSWKASSRRTPITSRRSAQKKRKEIRRQRNRLAEQGPVTFRAFSTSRTSSTTGATYLALEKAGWKGEAGSALRLLARRPTPSSAT